MILAVKFILEEVQHWDVGDTPKASNMGAHYK